MLFKEAGMGGSKPLSNGPQAMKKGNLPANGGRDWLSYWNDDMEIIDLFIGPVIERNGGYCYETFTRADGIRASFRYRRVEQAIHDRKVLLAEYASNPRTLIHECETLAEFGEAMREAHADDDACAPGLTGERG